MQVRSAARPAAAALVLSASPANERMAWGTVVVVAVFGCTFGDGDQRGGAVVRKLANLPQAVAVRSLSKLVAGDGCELQNVLVAACPYAPRPRHHRRTHPHPPSALPPASHFSDTAAARPFPPSATFTTCNLQKAAGGRPSRAKSKMR